MPIDLAEITGAKAAQEAKKAQGPKIANGLDKDAFMKLFLEQLKNQDPTAPMETDKIITQTAQLTQVEMQEENKKTMKEVASAMQSTKESNEALKTFQSDLKNTLEKLDKGMEQSIDSNAYLAQVSALNAVSMIGKIVETDVNGIHVKGDGDVDFALYFDNPIHEDQGNPTIQIFDKDKNLIATLPIEGKEGQSGYISFKWNGLDDKGVRVKEGSYDIRAEYNLNSHTNQYQQSRVGRGEVDSVVFDKGKPMIKMGAMVLPMDSAIEFYDKEKGDEQHNS
ncbi:flagellar hook assembly protein FlgD [Helicobacter mustelae]|uniref:Basal-body rod modification protein FlgD n=1 Tax=Helicobacter mustelae (strain ATCC 43772 / CCUG 25715 / CIP 103759 / LMG 18044 / NCTC 12198 / R85-136P) TaxID=679897 RepID=D3UHR5_HELM1|nr:flagellar hook assembly protein FlgD [Helicobacter mustelae]CBG40038.1 Putative flagellar-hook assembly protein, FlgD [Helicobacter mustelae 12198]SQH71551.1 flagellar-hook assembly protein FlgD [Helicobacter mustelae]STP12676.1 flagellar-hook assembly protein FlgD [Helicobacter mustelae]